MTTKFGICFLRYDSETDCDDMFYGELQLNSEQYQELTKFDALNPKQEYKITNVVEIKSPYESNSFGPKELFMVRSQGILFPYFTVPVEDTTVGVKTVFMYTLVTKSPT